MDADRASGGLQCRLADAVQTLVIDRPHTANALDTATRKDLVDALVRASCDPGVRAVVLTATGSHAFCAGPDLTSPSVPTCSAPPPGPTLVPGDMARLIAGGWQTLVASILDCEKPVIAAVNGLAAGGGMSLVLACDVVIMARTARLIPAWVCRGLAPDAAGAYLAAHLVGPRIAKRMLFLGDDVSADDALRLGLADEVVDAEELEAAVQGLAQRLASGPTRALAVTKALVNRALEVDRATALREEAVNQEVLTGTDDAREGLSAFAERRPPRFTGR